MTLKMSVVVLSIDRIISCDISPDIALALTEISLTLRRISLSSTSFIAKSTLPCLVARCSRKSNVMMLSRFMFLAVVWIDSTSEKIAVFRILNRHLCLKKYQSSSLNFMVRSVIKSGLLMASPSSVSSPSREYNLDPLCSASLVA